MDNAKLKKSLFILLFILGFARDCSLFILLLIIHYQTEYALLILLFIIHSIIHFYYLFVCVLFESACAALASAVLPVRLPARWPPHPYSGTKGPKLNEHMYIYIYIYITKYLYRKI